MSGIFGRSQQPAGTSDALIGTTQTTPPEKEGVPAFEGTESGKVTESEPAQNGGDQDQGNDGNQNQGDQTQVQNGSQPQQIQFDPATAYAIQAANEAKVAAEVARQLAQQSVTSTEDEDTFEEISILGEFSDDELVSDGEKRLVSAAKKLEEGLNTTRKELAATQKQLKAAEDNASKTNIEFEIQRAMTHYGVTRAELETAYQRSNGKVEDLNILAESALYARIAHQQQQQTQTQVQTQVQKATEERGQESSVVGQQQSSNGNNGTQTTSTDGPRGGGKLNPFNGAEIAKHYSAFA